MSGIDCDAIVEAAITVERLYDVYAYAERVIPGCLDMDWKERRALGVKGKRIDRLLERVSRKSVDIDYAETTHDLRVAVAAAASVTFVPPHWRGSRRAMALVEAA